MPMPMSMPAKKRCITHCSQCSAHHTQPTPLLIIQHHTRQIGHTISPFLDRLASFNFTISLHTPYSIIFTFNVFNLSNQKHTAFLLLHIVFLPQFVLLLAFITPLPLREALKKKLRDYLGIFPKRRTPPHPPLLGTPRSK